jgi:hypothetical protein
MADRGPTTKSVDEDLGELAKEMRDLGRRTDESIAGLRTDLAGIKNDLKWIKGIGAVFVATFMAFVGGAVNVAWNASALNSEVKAQGEKLGELKSEVKGQGVRLDGIDAKLDILVHRGEPKAKGE